MTPTRRSTARTSRSLTKKGLATRTALLEAARQVFKEQGYYGASVSEISRRSGLAQGSFYQYFKNKEQILLEINDLIITSFLQQAEELTQVGLDFETRLRRAVGLLFNHIRDNFYFHRILGEFELIDPVTIGYHDALARFYRRFFRHEAAQGTIRPLDPNLIAYGLIGLTYFQAMDWGPDREVFSPEQIVDLTLDLIRRGIAGPKPWTPSPLPVPSVLSADNAQPPVPEKDLTQGQKTKRAIFQAAEQVFGQVGFNRANISEITRRAGVAQGTFYVHFKSKRDLLQGFVEYLSREMRLALRQATDRVSDRRDQEREGLLAFFRFLTQHRRIYRVVAESETMGQEISMWYYNKLAEGYTAGLAEGIARGEIRDLPPAFLARALMGFNHMIGLKWLVWNTSPHAKIPRQLLEEAIEFVLKGLRPA